MLRIKIAALVEGDGEVEAVPVLIRRMADALGVPGGVHVLRPIRVPASRLLREHELERYVQLAVCKLGGVGGILLLLDSEEECPATHGPRLKERMAACLPGLPFGVVLAHREFESWFIGAASSIRGRRGFPESMASHPSPESIRGCKEWLSERLPRGRVYSPVEDQPALAAVFDMNESEKHCPSFGKFRRELAGILEAVTRIAGTSSHGG